MDEVGNKMEVTLEDPHLSDDQKAPEINKVETIVTTSPPEHGVNTSLFRNKKFLIGILLILVVSVLGLLLFIYFLRQRESSESNTPLNTLVAVPTINPTPKTTKTFLPLLSDDDKTSMGLFQTDKYFNHYAYIVNEPWSNVADRTEYVILDGEKVTDEVDSISHFQITPDNKYLAFITLNYVGAKYTPYLKEPLLDEDELTFVTVNLESKEVNTIDNVNWFIYSKDGSGLAYKTIDSSNNLHLNINGTKDYGIYSDRNPEFSFSENGKHYIFWEIGEADDGNNLWWYVNVDGKILESYYGILESNIDNEGNYYFIKQDVDNGTYNYYVQTNEEELGPYSSKHVNYSLKNYEAVYLPEKYKVSTLIADRLLLSEDGTSYAYRKESTAGTYYLINDKPTKSHDSTVSFSFSSDGKHYYYKAKENQDIFVVTDTYESPPYDIASSVSFCNDDHFAFTAHRGNKSFLVLNGNQTEINYESVSSLQFSNDCKNIIYIGRNETGYFLEKIQL